MNVRTRVSIDSDLLSRAKRYACLAHMDDLSGLVAEALEQHMKRYPREERDRSLSARVAEVEKMLGIGMESTPQVPAGTLQGIPEGGQ